MTKTALIVNAGTKFAGKGGTLSTAYAEKAAEILRAAGWNVLETRVDSDWSVKDEVDKVMKADFILAQIPAWWMGAPWTYKRWFDTVFMNVPFGGDGRTHTNPAVNYGRGGHLKGYYMLSTTWNAPRNAFVDPKEFFEGKGIDGVIFPLHKAFQFVGLKPLETFMANDVIKNPTFEADMARFEKTLKANIAKIA
ncbi:MAG: Flavodoxin-2 domain-containing protein [Burkholderia sp.]|jgi:NADPH dehydrogenase (quinone)